MSTFAAVAIRIDGTTDAINTQKKVDAALDTLVAKLEHRMELVQAVHIPAGIGGTNGTLVLIGTGELPD